MINVVRGYGPTLNRTFSARHDRWCTMPSGDAPVKRWTRPLRTSRRTLHARPFGPGNSDQSRPSSSQTRRTTRGSRVCRDPPRGTSALRTSQWTMTMTGPSPRFSCPWSKRHPRSASHFRNVALCMIGLRVRLFMRPKQQHENAIGNSERDNCWREPLLSFMCAVPAHRRQQKPNHRKKVQPRDDPDQKTS